MFRPAGRRGVSWPRPRGTFAHGGKSTQKRHLNLRFKNPPTLYCVRICCHLPRDCGTWLLSFRMTHRISSCVAAADVINGRTNSVVRHRHQRQRRWCRNDPFNGAKMKITRERVVKAYKSAQRIARREVKEPEVPSGAFAYFCHC